MISATPSFHNNVMIATHASFEPERKKESYQITEGTLRNDPDAMQQERRVVRFTGNYGGRELPRSGIYDAQQAKRYFFGDDCVMRRSPWTNTHRKHWP
jgi:hypothetical protein